MTGCGTSSQGGGEGSAAVTPEASNVVDVPTNEADRPFVRVYLDKAVWRVTENNTLGVQTAIMEGIRRSQAFTSRSTDSRPV